MNIEAYDKAHSVLRGVVLDRRDLVIPLAISVNRWRHPNVVVAAASSIQPLILAALMEAAREGWKADQPTDFATLFSRSQVRTTVKLLHWRVTSVTIRLTRSIYAHSRYSSLAGASAHSA